MLISSLQFGPMDVPEDKIISMTKPVLGFEQLDQFCLIEREELLPFLWLQATDDPEVAFMVMNPLMVDPSYRIEVNPKEVGELTIRDVQKVETYVIVTTHADPEKITANMQGPILINTENNLAKQLVLANSDYRVRESIMDALDNITTPEETRKSHAVFA
ncbi:MAG: flagellar assembly protein FliW [Candidatus Zixiibacteriota bacterium]